MMPASLFKLGQMCLAVTILLGCQHRAPVAAPALLPSGQAQPACLEQIQASIEKDTGTPVSLTNAAFAQSDLLHLSPAPVLDSQGRLAQGRVRGVPASYRLSKQEGSCYLLSEKTSQRTLLGACQCQSLDSR